MSGEDFWGGGDKFFFGIFDCWLSLIILVEIFVVCVLLFFLFEFVFFFNILGDWFFIVIRVVLDFFLFFKWEVWFWKCVICGDCDWVLFWLDVVLIER